MDVVSRTTPRARLPHQARRHDRRHRPPGRPAPAAAKTSTLLKLLGTLIMAADLVLSISGAGT